MEETERTVVKTYVPRYQKETWEREADGLGMSQSEFVRTMVQAGRRGIGVEEGSPATNPGGNALETGLEELLADGPRSWEELTAELESALEAMQSAGRVRYAPGEGYTLE